ncbi:MAG: hypothetical protein OXU81_09675, partial [Gammaproteobacteria bacterium]|nr:hypothetical protein [Gammaproteobacteria bacterium]
MKTTTAALVGAQPALSPIAATREIRRRRHPRTTPLLTTAVLAVALSARTLFDGAVVTVFDGR